MKRAVTLLAALSLAVGAMAQESASKDTQQKDPVEILKKADAATKAVKNVGYNATLSATGPTAARFPSGEGSVLLVQPENPDGALGKYKVEAKMHMPNSSEVREIVIGGDGENFFLIDPANKIAYQDMDPAVIGRAGQMARALVMGEYTHPTPFSDEINADKAELEAVIKIGDVDCYQIRVTYARGGGEAVWYFGTKDFLPRRLDRIFKQDGGGSTQLVLTELTVNPKIAGDAFKLALPEGFTLSDDFAP